MPLRFDSPKSSKRMGMAHLSSAGGRIIGQIRSAVQELPAARLRIPTAAVPLPAIKTFGAAEHGKAVKTSF